MARELSAAPAARRRPQLNSRTLFVLGAMNLIDCINACLLLPYVDKMVSAFLATTPDDPEVARVVSLLVGVYSLCEVLFSVAWGCLADRIGRKPALLIGLGGSVVAPVLFGLGRSLPWAFGARILDGFFCGNVGVTRTYLGEIVDASNEARGFGFLAFCFSIGMFVGPMLGGGLVYPAQWAPGVFGGTLFEDFPYLLPNLVYAGFASAAWLIGALCLEETLPDAPWCPRRRAAAVAAGPAGPAARPQAAALLSCEEPAQAEGQGAAAGAAAVAGRYPAKLLLAIATRAFTLGFTSVRMQVFVLVVSLPRAVRGFGLQPHEIGALQNFAAAGLLTSQLCLYRRLSQRFGFYRCFCMAWVPQLLALLLFPVWGLFWDEDVYGVWRYLPLAAMLFAGSLGAGFCAPTTLVWINRAAAGRNKGAVNGWAASCTALAQAVLPMAAGLLLSWGQRWGGDAGRYLPVYANCAIGCVALAVGRAAYRRAQSEGGAKPVGPSPPDVRQGGG